MKYTSLNEMNLPHNACQKVIFDGAFSLDERISKIRISAPCPLITYFKLTHER